MGVSEVFGFLLLVGAVFVVVRAAHRIRLVCSGGVDVALRAVPRRRGPFSGRGTTGVPGTTATGTGGPHRIPEPRAAEAKPPQAPSPRGWHWGVGRYGGDVFSWFRIASLRSGPDRVLDRDHLEIVDRRAPSSREASAIPSEAVVLRCRTNTGELELAMCQDTLTGFLSWLESAPPGRHTPPWAS